MPSKVPEPPDRPEPPPEDSPPPGPSEGDTLDYGSFDDDDPFEAVEELQERLARKETELDQTREKLLKERNERDEERVSVLRWMVTQTFSTLLGIAIVIIAVLGAIFYQIFSVNSELREKGERLAQLELLLPAASTSSDSSATTPPPVKAMKEKSDRRPPRARH